MGDSLTCVLDSKSSKTLDLKRSLSGDIDHGVKKKLKTEETSNLNSMKSFVDLSEDVLLILLSHIAHNDLVNLAKTCRRMDRIVRDWRLWKTITSHSEPIPMTCLQEFMPYVLKCTEEVNLTLESEALVVGDNDIETVENEAASMSLASFLNHLYNNCNVLTSLSLEHVTVDARRFQIQMFPPSLKKFSLAYSKLVNLSTDVSYFYGFDSHFPNIEVLNLSWCSWFTPHSLIALSKSKNLQELYLQGCRKIKNCVPYTSLSVRFGFKALRVLDLRFTYISDSEVTIIYDMPCLSHLYLAAPTPKRLEDFSISDRSITMLCTSAPRNDFNGYVQMMRAASVRVLLVPDASKVAKTFHTLVVTGYPGITNITLRHAAGCLAGLRLLDVRGSSCTSEAAAQFRESRPEVKLLAGPDPDPHPPALVFDPPSPIPLLPGLRVVLHRIENNQPVNVILEENNNEEEGGEGGDEGYNENEGNNEIERRNENEGNIERNNENERVHADENNEDNERDNQNERGNDNERNNVIVIGRNIDENERNNVIIIERNIDENERNNVIVIERNIDENQEENERNDAENERSNYDDERNNYEGNERIN